MSRIIVRTVYGSAVQTARNLGIDHDIPADYAALNYGGVPSLNVGAINNPNCIANLPTPIYRGMETAPVYTPAADTDLIRQGFFCIGNRGHRYVQTTNPNLPAYATAIPHRASDSGLYGLIPFVVKPFANDFAPNSATRAKYRLRRTLDIGGNLYVAYFGKVLDFTGVTPETQLVTIVNGEEVPSSFIPTIASLDPDPNSVSNPVPQNDAASYMSVSATLVIQFTAAEVTDILEACELLFGNEEFAVISEIALCTGVDKLCDTRYADTNPYASSAIVANQPTEAVGMQVATHISTHYPVVYSNDGLKLTFNVGATEPLFGVGSV